MTSRSEWRGTRDDWPSAKRTKPRPRLTMTQSPRGAWRVVCCSLGGGDNHLTITSRLVQIRANWPVAKPLRRGVSPMRPAASRPCRSAWPRGVFGQDLTLGERHRQGDRQVRDDPRHPRIRFTGLDQECSFGLGALGAQRLASPSSTKISPQSSMHSSQMHTFGPAIILRTSRCPLPQDDHESSPWPGLVHAPLFEAASWNGATAPQGGRQGGVV